MARPPLKAQVEAVREQHQLDNLKRGGGWVPHALDRKYPNGALGALAVGVSRGPRLPPRRDAQLFGGGTDISAVLRGQVDRSTTMIYTRAATIGPAATRSPADRLLGPPEWPLVTPHNTSVVPAPPRAGGAGTKR